MSPAKALTPPPIKKRLRNGLTILYLHTPADPVSACHLFLPAGAAQEPAAQSGVSMLAWALITKGTLKRSSKAYAEDIEALGAGVSAGVTHDYSEVSCHAITEYFPKALILMAEALLQPSFAVEEVEKERGALVAAIRSKKESIFTTANEELNRRLYGSHSYNRPSTGNESTVASLNQKKLMDWHRRITAPTGSVLAVATSLPPAKLLPEIERLLGSAAWPAKKTTLPRMSRTPLRAPGKHVVLRERFEQAYLLVGYPAPPAFSKEYLALKVLNAVLGGGMSARLFQSLREERGLAYDVGSFYPTKSHGSAFVSYMGLQYSRLEEAKAAMLEAFRVIADKPVPKDELEQIKSYLKGTFILDHQTNSQRAHYLGWWEALGMGHAYDNRYLKGLEGVTSAAVQSVAKKVLGQPPIIIEIHPAKKTPAPAEALA